MDKVKVLITRSNDYDCDQIYTGLQKNIAFIGGLQDIISPAVRVFVKINHLPPASPAEKGIVTHPIFVEAVLRLLKETGASIIVGDDVESSDRDGFEISGFRQMSKRAEVELLNLREAGFVVYVSKIVLDADVIVNLPKLKTHSLTVLTGGVKNIYGIIPEGLRKRFHGEYTKREDFCQVLTDIFSITITKPQLTIMDSIIAMEGEGPACGSLKRSGIILASWDAVALDAVATKILGLNPLDIYTTKYAAERGLGIGDLRNIEIVGENLEDGIVADFRLPAGATGSLIDKLPAFLSRYIQDQRAAKPHVIESECTGCLECQNNCPASAISATNEKIRINRTRCIRCMCCHEVCRYGAIVPKVSIIGNMLDLFADRWQRLMASIR
jgi:uncharacterized protein (DUF362 family)/Pyruvate/2-oxoacid:ferredoxin oxidoreductase delta subunit